jgi:hypothetical protein
MKAIVTLCALALSAVSLVAYAGEGNGPDYPGMEVPDVKIITGGIGAATAVDTIHHSM